MEPIDTYSERLLQVRRDFALYPDRVVIRARWLLGRRVEQTVQLACLSPEPRPLTIRQKAARWAGWIFALGLLILAMAEYNRKGGAVGPLEYAGALVAAAGAALIFVTYPPKVRFVRFDAEPGKRALDIGRAGPDKQRFEQFVQRVQKQIRQARRSGSAKE
jgi:hypothetical protein